MNLDDFKHATRNVTSPEGSPSGNIDISGFIADLRSRDQREKRLLMGKTLIYLSLGLVFAGATLGLQTGNKVIGVGFILVALYASLKIRWFGRVNYGAPAKEFLKAAARRYQFWRAEDVFYVIPLLLIMSVGGGLTVWRIVQKFFSHPHPLLILGGYALFIFTVSVIAFIQGRKLWQKKYAAFLDEIGRRQKELENG